MLDIRISEIGTKVLAEVPELIASVRMGTDSSQVTPASWELEARQIASTRITEEQSQLDGAETEEDRYQLLTDIKTIIEMEMESNNLKESGPKQNGLRRT